MNCGIKQKDKANRINFMTNLNVLSIFCQVSIFYYFPINSKLYFAQRVCLRHCGLKSDVRPDKGLAQQPLYSILKLVFLIISEAVPKLQFLEQLLTPEKIA
jgi:hypothetical protein